MKEKIKLSPEASRREFVPVHYKVHYNIVRYLLVQAVLQTYFSLRMGLKMRNATGFADDEALTLLGVDILHTPEEMQNEINEMLQNYAMKIHLPIFNQYHDGDKLYDLFLGILNKYAETGEADYYIPEQ